MMRFSNNMDYIESNMEQFYDDDDNYGGFIKTVKTKQNNETRKDGRNKQDKQKLREAKRSWETQD